ncbi:MAG: hypothetical protein CM1200mP41_31770 [Gammaproteobacteria bacterium]|nr:MAG: hypothetical protein CM1200mP41_31770 [Gammaproteobacteria bacterium]
MRLADRVVIVTGGAAGMGLAFASRLLNEGAAIVIADIKGHRARSQCPRPLRSHVGATNRCQPGRICAVND